MSADKPSSVSSKDAARSTPTFYRTTIENIKEGDSFYPEYIIFQRTIEAVNSFNSLYKFGRTGAKGGPATHAQQDLNRAMLVFACAGLDVLVKQLVRTKLPRLVETDKAVAEKFKQYVKKGLERGEVLNTVALALIDPNPRTMLLSEYISRMTEDSLQSVEELSRVSSAAGLETNKIFTNEKRNRLRDAFIVRNQIIHEMDISVADGNSRTTGHRTRRQRTSQKMADHTRQILDLGQELFLAFKDRFNALKIDVEKARSV